MSTAQEPRMIGTLMGKTKPKLINRPSQELVCPDSDVGLEFEYEGVRNGSEEATELYFDAKEDHSLHDNGLEFVFKQPLNGMDIIQAVSLMCDTAKRHKYKSSLRTGIHVHLDVRDLSRTQFIGLLAYYTLFEPMIYNWVGDDRDANNFCLPYFKARGSLEQAVGVTRRLFAEGASAGAYARHAAENYGKYAGLNLRSMATFGSIEFRHLKTISDKDKIIEWLNLIFSLKRAATNIPTSTTAGLFDPLLRAQQEQLVTTVFGPELAPQLMGYPGWYDEMMGLGLPNALQILGTTDKILEPTMRRKGGNIHDPWGEGDAEEEKPAEKSHPAIRGWEAKHFPKGWGPAQPKPSASLESLVAVDEVNVIDQQMYERFAEAITTRTPLGYNGFTTGGTVHVPVPVNLNRAELAATAWARTINDIEER